MPLVDQRRSDCRHSRIAPAGLLLAWLLLSIFAGLSTATAATDPFASGENIESIPDTDPADHDAVDVTPPVATEGSPDSDHPRALQLHLPERAGAPLPDHPALRPRREVITARAQGPPTAPRHFA